MKRLVAMLLCGVMAFSFTACGNSDKGGTESQKPSQDSQQDTSKDTQQGSQGGEQTGGEQTGGDALSMLTVIWDNFPEDGKFSCVGGNMTADPVENAPGKFDVSDTDGMNLNMLLPESVQPNVDDAAFMQHLMNENTFRGAVIHLKDGGASDAAAAIKEKILGNQWLCGFPDKLAVFTVGDYVIYAFGSEMNIDNFVSVAKDQISGVVEVFNDFI